MGDFPRAILIACLQVLRWLLLASAALLVILLVVQQLRGDVGAAPMQLGLAAVFMALAGLVCGKGAAWLLGNR